jgi:3-hydroxyisobutyrate dehydrogenase
MAESPAELASSCEVIFVAVVNDAQVKTVLAGEGGALASAKPGAVVVVISTVTLETLHAMADAAREHGVELVDCGVSGGTVGAATGELVSMVGGSDEIIARITPVLDAFSCLVIAMGPLGAGMQAKLARNLVQYGSWLAAYEAQLLAEAAGIELAKLATAIQESDKRIGGPSRLMFRETVAPFEDDANEFLVNAMRAGAGLAHKDVRAALELADELGVDLPLARLTEAHTDRVFGLDKSLRNTAD